MDTLITAATAYLIKFLSDHNLLGLLAALLIAGATLYGGGWLVTTLFGISKTRAEAYKTSAEHTKTRLEILEKLLAKEREYEKKQELLNLQLGALVDAARRQDATDAAKLREEVIATLAQEYLGAFGEYLDFFDVIQPRSDCVAFISHHVLKHLDASAAIVATVNSPALLDAIGRVPFSLTRASYHKVWRFCAKHLRAWNILLRWRLRCSRRRFAK